MPDRLAAAGTLTAARATTSLPALRSCLVVAVRQVLEHARSFWVWSLVVVAVALSALSTRVHVETLKVKTAIYGDLSEQRERDRARTAGHATGWQVEPGLRAVRPPEPLSVVVTGLDGSLPHFWDFSPSGTRAGRVSAEPSDIATVSGSIDLEFILRYVLGLLAIGLAVETIAGERASGALLAVLGQPVRPELVLTGKFTGGLVTLGAAVGLVAATTIAAVALAEPTLLTRDLAATIALVSSAGLLYLFTYFVAGVALASAIPSYRSALIATLITWILTAVVALPAAGVVAEALSPVQPRSQLEAECEEIAQARTVQAQLRMGDAYVESFGNDDDGRAVDRLPVSEPVLRARLEPIWQQYAQELRSELDRHRLAAEAGSARQRHIAHVLARISPSAQFTAAATSLTGEGDRAAQRWEQATTEYQMTMDRLLFDDRPRLTVLVPPANAPRDNPAGRAIVGFNRRPRPTFEALPAFRDPERTLAVHLADAAPHLAGLAAYAAVLVGIAFIAFNRLRF